ncbi:MFS transporter [Paracidobacterium acidisoli]|uniref:MFS transporter n=1 Tax=Paracidobacterium acidisoli TaxID=2303751 RepID=A0A372IJN0_9BACT|nr:MFS transporter [Paracidobacterium acidisoli]MBT9332965.1 MFS transporter [Paracidobacterium acidisoli]
MKASRARYGVVALAVGLAVLSYVQRVAISEAAGPISRDLHLSREQMGLVFGAFGLSYALFELPMGLLGDRLGVRRVLAQIVLAWSAFTALTGAAWNVLSLWVIRFLFGAGEAGCFPNLTRMLSVWLPERERVTAQSLMWAATRWGGAATPPLALVAITLLGWRWAFVSFAALGLIWCAIFLFWFRDDPLQHRSVNDLERKMLETSRAFIHGDTTQHRWLSLLLTPQIFVLVLQYFCFSFVWYFYITWLPTYLREARGQSAGRAAAFAVLPLLFGGFGSLLTGLVAARIPRRVIAFFGFLGSAILLFAFTRIHGVMPAMLCMGAASFCSDLTMPISWDACVEIGGPYTATVAAAMNMLGNLAGFVAPVLGGFILERTGGDWNPLIYLMVGAAIISALSWLYLDPESAGRRRRADPDGEKARIDAEGASL